MDRHDRRALEHEENLFAGRSRLERGADVAARAVGVEVRAGRVQRQRRPARRTCAAERRRSTGSWSSSRMSRPMPGPIRAAVANAGSQGPVSSRLARRPTVSSKSLSLIDSVSCRRSCLLCDARRQCKRFSLDRVPPRDRSGTRRCRTRRLRAHARSSCFTSLGRLLAAAPCSRPSDANRTSHGRRSSFRRSPKP